MNAFGVPAKYKIYSIHLALISPAASGILSNLGPFKYHMTLSEEWGEGKRDIIIWQTCNYIKMKPGFQSLDYTGFCGKCE